MPSKRFFILRSGFRNLKLGYSLIELLVVISVFGITITLVTASYLTFERNQRFKNAALQLKSDTRFVQNKALASDKSSTKCATAGYTLVGWYMTVAVGSTTYTFNSDCKNGAGAEDPDSPAFRTVSLPKGMSICGLSSGVSANIFFQPLSRGVTIHSSATPPFLDSNGNLRNQISVGSPFTISLTNSGISCNAGGTYQVVILPTGEVSEDKL